MSEKKLDMSWDKDTKEENNESNETVEPKVKNKAKVNKNLTPNEMKIILDEYEADDEYEDVEPFIVKSTKRGGSRFYIIRSILMSDTSKIDELFAVFQEEELEKETKDAHNKWMKDNGVEQDTITSEKKEEMDAYTSSVLNSNGSRILTRVNDKVINILGVVYPKDHKDKVLGDKTAIGDLQSLSMAIQVLSGWSGVSNDIDVFEKAEFEDTQENDSIYDM